MTSHSEKLNMDRMTREVYCYDCKLTATTNAIQAFCPTCGKPMTKLVRSVLTNEPLVSEKK